MDEIKVSVVKFPDRTNLMLRYIDPITGKQSYKSAATAKRSEATEAAGKWESDLRAGVVQSSNVTWPQFRERYEREVLTSLAATTDKKAQGVFNAVEKHIAPGRLRDLTAERLSYLQSKLREAGRSEDTIKGHTAHLIVGRVCGAAGEETCGQNAEARKGGGCDEGPADHWRRIRPDASQGDCRRGRETCAVVAASYSRTVAVGFATG
jgi:hypothetical protein